MIILVVQRSVRVSITLRQISWDVLGLSRPGKAVSVSQAHMRSLGLVCVREGTQAVDPAWCTRQTPISEDKGLCRVSSE